MNVLEECIYSIQAATEQWTDQRVIEATDLESLLLFMLYVPKVLSQKGLSYKGHICRRKGGQTLLTIKATESGTPLVVFVTSGTTLGCMHRFLDQFEDDRLSWIRDKYPWI